METADRKNCGFTVGFDACRPTLRAIGDETRRIIIRVLIENCEKDGMRVGEIQKRANISRAAVSHHLKILKEAGIIDFRREGAKNFYYLDPDGSSLIKVAELFLDAAENMKQRRKHKEENI